MCTAITSFCSRKLPRIFSILKETRQCNYSTVANSAKILTKDEILKSPIWFRHHCRCEKCFNCKTNQRLIIPSSLKEISTVKSIVQVENSKGSDYKITWNDDHVSHYDSSWLEQWDIVQHDPKNYSQLANAVKYVDGAKTQERIPKDIKGTSINYDDFMNMDDGVRELLKNIKKDGYGFISNTPPTIDATRKAIERVFTIMNTLYGDLYEFQSDYANADTSSTSEYIHLHTDTTYFNESAGLQVFHCLMHDGEGGLNSLVDGFKVAHEIREENPDHYQVLKNTLVPWQYIDTGKHHFYNIAPIFQHNPFSGELECVRYNPHDMALLNTIPKDEIAKFYDILVYLSQKIEASPVWFKLNPGTVIFLDNWRLLHGRAAFTGSRKMCGAYISRSDWMSKCRVLLK